MAGLNPATVPGSVPCLDGDSPASGGYCPAGQSSTMTSLIGKSPTLAVARLASRLTAADAIRQSA